MMNYNWQEKNGSYVYADGTRTAELRKKSHIANIWDIYINGLLDAQNILDAKKGIEYVDGKLNKQESEEAKDIENESRVEQELLQLLKENIQLPDANFLIKDTVKIVGTGGGKTYNVAYRICQYVLGYGAKRILIVSTKDNFLLSGIVQEVVKILRNGLQGKVIEEAKREQLELLLSEIERKNGESERLGISLMNSFHTLKLNSDTKVIITNHAYFFCHGHRGSYNKNIVKIHNEFLNSQIEIVYDEFDTFHKQGLSIIPLNYFVGKNLDDKTKDQTWIADISIKYAKKRHLDKNKELMWELPKECFGMEYEENKGIYEFKKNLHGEFNLHDEFLQYYEPIKTQDIITAPNSFTYEQYKFVRFDRITQYSIIPEMLEVEGKTQEFLKLLFASDVVATCTQIIKIYKINDGKNELVEEATTPQKLIDWCKSNISRDSFFKLHGNLVMCGEELYIKHLIICKRPFNSFNSSNYYLTATKSQLEAMGYSIDESMAEVTSPYIKDLELFVKFVKNSANKYIDEIIKLSNGNSYNTLAVVNKKDALTKMINENSINLNYSHVKVVSTDATNNIKSTTMDIGSTPESYLRSEKNTVVVYQNGTETTGKNYGKTTFLILNANCKNNIKERLIPTKIDGRMEITIPSYEEISFTKIVQTFGRILRGSEDMKYKACFMLLDESERGLYEKVLAKIKSYGFNLKVQELEKDITKIKQREEVFANMLKIVESKHRSINCMEEATPVTTEIEKEIVTGVSEVEKVEVETNINLDRRTMKQAKYDEAEAWKTYNMVKRYEGEKQAIHTVMTQFGISEKTVRRLKAKMNNGNE